MLAHYIVGYIPVIFFGSRVDFLFELAVLLETMFLGHGSALLFALEFFSASAEVVQFSVEYLVFLELAVERTVVKRDFNAWFQSYAVEAFLVV